MTDIFISYSRKDKKFVEVLHQALEKSKYETWVDWDDIPLTADWWEEVKDGIETAHTFIFVMSPDSISSEICGQEIDHAEENNKRLVPIMHREGFEDVSVKLSLKRPNWIYFTVEDVREKDDFDKKFQELVEAINLDLAHAKAHTQLLKDAIRWDREKREESLLLSGKTLEKAYQWLTQASRGKEPKPIPLQADYYITCSRKTEVAKRDAQIKWKKAEIERQRDEIERQKEAEIEQQRAETERLKKARKKITFALIGASVGLFLTAILSRFSVYQWRQGAHIRMELYEARAKNLADTDELVSLINGLAAIGLGRSSFIKFPHLGQDALVSTAVLDRPNRSMKSRYIAAHIDEVTSVAFSPDGQTLVSGSGDNTVRLWDLQGNAIGAPFRGHTDAVISVAFSLDDQTVVSGSYDKTVRLWPAGFSGDWIPLTCDRLRVYLLFSSKTDHSLREARRTCEKYRWKS